MLNNTHILNFAKTINNMAKLETEHDRIVLKKVEIEYKRTSAVLLSDVNGEKAETYEVVATGPGRYNDFKGEYIPTGYKKGDTVIVKKGLLHELKFNGEIYYVTRDIEILAKVVEND